MATINNVATPTAIAVRPRLPNKPLRNFTMSDAEQGIGSVQVEGAEVNQLFVDGDHWQAGNGWIGPMPAASEAGAAEVILAIKKNFTSRNVVLEVTERHANGVTGREPAWGFGVRRELKEDEEPSLKEQAAIDEAEALLTEWWNVRGIHTLILEAVKTSLHQGRSVLRLYVPRGRLATRTTETEREDGSTVVEETLVAAAPSVEEALDMIFVDSPHPSAAAVIQDPLDMRPVGFYRFTQDDKPFVDITFVDGEATVLRRVGYGGEGAPYRYNIGGRLLMDQIDRGLLVTEQVQQQQRALNLAESMIPRNVVTGGFLERIILNAQMPGYFEDDDSMPTGRRFVPAPFYAGPGTTNFLEGISYTDREGNESVATPSVNFRPPVAPTASVEAAAAHYRNILDEVDQAHHLISGDATASGASRVEARLDFLNSLRRTQAEIQRVGRWLLEATLALAEAIAGVSGQYTNVLAARFDCRLQVGQLTSEEQEALANMVEKGLIPKEDAMSILGVDDVDSALARINNQPGAMLEMRIKQAEAVAAWINAGVTLPVAAQLIGWDKDSDEYKLLAAMDPTEGGAVLQQ